MKRKKYLKPETQLLETMQELNFCASDLGTSGSGGIENWIEDGPGEWIF